ncbi:MAG: zinc ribbon domain-containing protein [Deltaproteobacteria bacterium]|nr:zinc ribbon domain-containing protein [Deltaproteobacteria bacterium]
MPIYEYKCRKCEAVAERIEGIHDGPMRKCPSCGGKVDRMISPGAFHLKGSGWYATDYGSKNHGNGNGKAKKPPGEASCPASTGSEPAPACAGCPKLD